MRRLLRPFLLHPLHPLLAVGVLAAGLATSVSAFTYLRAFDRPFPGVDTDGLVRLVDPRDDQAFGEVSYLDYLDLLEASATLELGAVQRYYAASVRHEESAEVAFMEAVAGEYFPVLGARAHLGRLLGPDDDRPGSDPTAVISWQWWQTAFGGREDILGHTLVLNFRPFTVVGVVAPEFLGSNADARPQLWMPLAHFRTRYTNWDALAQNRDVPLVTVLGRLRGSSTLASAGAEIARLAANLDEAHPREVPRRFALQEATWIDPSAREAERDTLRIMTLAAVGFLLLVCANVANVFLSMTSTRARANAIRAAVGASPGRIVLEALGRNLVLSGAAALLGLAVAVPLSRRLGDYFARPSVWGEFVPRDFPVDLPVLGFGVALAVATGLVATLPALRATLDQTPRRALSPEADLQPRGSRPSRLRFTLRDVMIGVQSGLTVSLLILSGLVLRTFAVGSDLTPGYETTDLLGGLVSVSSLGIERTETRAFLDALQADLREEPWVRAVSRGDRLPLSGHPTVQVRSAAVDEPVPMIFETISHDFIETLGVEVLEGRDYASSDEGTDRGALLNRSAAGILFPDGGAVGRAIELPGSGGEPRRLEVLGVVADTRLRTVLEEPRPAVFLQFRDSLWGTTNALIVRTEGPADAVDAAELRRWLRAYAPHMTVINSIAYREVMDGALYTQRMNAELFSGLAALGLALACTGIFSVVSLSVARRRREIGIRKAIGATGRQIRLQMVRRAMIPVLVGGSAGLLLSLLGAGLAESLLFGVSPLDPTALLAGVAVLLGAAALAAWLPAWAASRAPVRTVVG
ncbi:MAG TPA: FtsX-like permease family protein [Longimicrobiales bacterium]|nr:FtsX-like permease family protein [Longimicrobiales bacterium]